MEMFLMGLCATVLVLGLAVAAVRFEAVTHSDSSDLAIQSEAGNPKSQLQQEV